MFEEGHETGGPKLQAFAAKKIKRPAGTNCCRKLKGHESRPGKHPAPARPPVLIVWRKFIACLGLFWPLGQGADSKIA